MADKRGLIPNLRQLWKLCSDHWPRLFFFWPKVVRSNKLWSWSWFKQALDRNDKPNQHGPWSSPWRAALAVTDSYPWIIGANPTLWSPVRWMPPRFWHTPRNWCNLITYSQTLSKLFPEYRSDCVVIHQHRMTRGCHSKPILNKGDDHER